MKRCVTLISREIYILLRNLLTTNQRWFIMDGREEEKYISSRRFPKVSKSEYSCRLYFEACG